MHWTEALSGKVLLVTDKDSEFYGHRGRMVHWESDKPDYIYFESYDPLFYGEDYLRRDQFTVENIDLEIKRIETDLVDLIEKKNILETFIKSV